MLSTPSVLSKKNSKLYNRTIDQNWLTISYFMRSDDVWKVSRYIVQTVNQIRSLVPIFGGKSRYIP